jgi:hypothetical protein
VSLFLNRFMMNLYERDRSKRGAGWREARKDAVLEGARSAWATFAEARNFAFDDTEAPCLRGLVGEGTPFTLEALLDTEAAPFMRVTLSPARAGTLVIKPLEPHHRLPFFGRVRTGARDFDAVMFMRGDERTCSNVHAEIRDLLLSLNYRRPWLLLKDQKLVAELDGIELDAEVLGRFIEALQKLA